MTSVTVVRAAVLFLGVAMIALGLDDENAWQFLIGCFNLAFYELLPKGAA